MLFGDGDYGAGKSGLPDPGFTFDQDRSASPVKKICYTFGQMGELCRPTHNRRPAPHDSTLRLTSAVSIGHPGGSR
jgi:hypothetical protein